MRCSEQLEHLNRNIYILLLSLLFFFSYSYSFEIKIKQFSKVKTEQIYLKDVSIIKVKNSEFKNFLENISIGKTPPPRKTTVVTRQDIIKILKTYHIDTLSLKITGEKCVVLSGLVDITKEKIKKDIIAFLKKRENNLKILSISIPDIDIYVPENYKKNIHIRSKTSRYMYINYEIHTGKLQKKIPVTVKYSMSHSVIVASRDISKNHKITKKDIKVVQMFNVRDGFIENINQVVGKIAKSRIRKGQIIKQYHIRPEYLIKKGDKVKVIYNKGFIRVEISGQALEDGEKDKVIKVKNISTGKKIKCKVIDKGTVVYTGN